MKRIISFGLAIVLLLLTGIAYATSEVDSTLFTPTITNALRIKAWFSTGKNRALLAFSLGANAADDAVLGRADILLAFMNNPSFVGKDSGSENLLAASLTETEMIFIYYSPTEGKAYVFTTPYVGGITQGTAKLDDIMGGTCSEYYRITQAEMQECLNYLRSVLN